jgi:hypothetical protein
MAKPKTVAKVSNLRAGASETRIQDYVKDFRRLQNQKTRKFGGIEMRVLTALCMVYGEHFVNQDGFSLVGRTLNDEDKNKLFLVFNMIGRNVWRKMGRLWSINNSFRATPNTLEPIAWDLADPVNKLILSMNRKLKEGQAHWNRLFWLLVSGVVVEHTPWVTEVANESLPEFTADGEMVWIDQWGQQLGGDSAQYEIPESLVMQAVANGIPPERFKPKEVVQLVGEVGSELFTPLDFFIDSSVKRISDLAGDQACYFAQLKTKGWIRDNFGSEIADQVKTGSDLNIVKTIMKENVGPTSANVNLRDLIPAIQGSRVEGDPEMAMVITRYTPRSVENPNGRRCIFTPEGIELDETEIGEYEGIPAVDIHWRPNATSFWTGDFVTDMVSGNKFLNKRMSQLGEASNAQIYEMLLLGGDLKRTDIPTDYHGVVPGGLDDQGNPLVKVMQRGQLPGFFSDSIRLSVEMIETIGSSDLYSNRKFPGQMRGPLAIPMLQEIMDSEDGPVYTHLGEQLAEIHQMRINRVKEFYEPIRTMHYTGSNNKDEVLIFHTQQVLRAGWDYHISVDRSSLLPELSSMREARVRERLESPLAALYMNRRTGRIDISKIADDLKYNDTGREDRESQFRKLAREFIMTLQQGKQLDPALPLSFYDHDVMMDEFEAVMSTTEWLRHSETVKKGFLDFYGKCQQYLQRLHDQQQSVMENKMLQTAVAQATQQAAAKAASVATEAALTQVDTQRDQLQGNPQNPINAMREQMQARAGGVQ